MQDPNKTSDAPASRLAVVTGAVVALLGCGVAGFIMAVGGELPSFIEDGLDLIVMALPDNFSVSDAIGWFLIIEGVFWLLGAGVYLAAKLPGIEHGSEAEALRQRMRANLSAADNAAAREELDSLKTNLIKRGFTFATIGAGSLFFAWVLLGGLVNF